MPTVKVFFNEKSVKKNGESAIYLIVHIDYKSLKFNTNVCCSTDNWDRKRKRIRGKSKQVLDDNLTIDNCISRMHDIFVRYRLQNSILTADLLKNEWKNPARRIDFYAFYEEAYKERKSDLAVGTYRHHKSLLNILKEFKPNLAFSEINPDYLIRFQRWLKSNRKNDVNTVHSKMRIFRTYLNIAIRKGIIHENPFAQVKLKKAQVNRVFLTSKEIKVLWDKYTKKELTDSKLKVLRHFLFMCFTGLRISDLRNLKHENIVGQTIFFTAMKTHKEKRNLIKVPLNKYAIRLIKDEKTKNGFVFKTISEQKMNDYIKKIVSSAGICKEITNHCGRHTFATLWLEKTSDLSQLQVLLGHSSITETMLYVHISEQGLQRQMSTFEKNIFD